MKKKPSYAKAFKQHKVIIIHDDGSLEHQQVYGIDNGTIETEFDMLPVEKATKFYDKTNGGFTFIYHLDLPAKVSSEELKSLRRSKVIQNIMSYDRESGMDIMKLVPYVVAIVAIMF